MSNKLIIISTSLFLLVSFVYLSVQEKKQADINTKNLWMTYFNNPKDSSLDFTIENHSDHTSFHWQILTDTAVTNEGDTSLSLGESKKIPVSMSSDETTGKKITISVTTDDENKQIYKTFANN